MSASSARVLVADEHDLCRAGLCAMLQQGLTLSVFSQAASFADLNAALEQGSSIGLVAVNVRMLGMDGLRRFRLSYPTIRWVVIGPTPDREVVLQALAVGVHGYVPLDLPATEIQAAFRSILAGQVYVPPTVCELSRCVDPTDVDAAPKPVHLTNRQQEVLALLASGKSHREMSLALGIAEGTVKIHMAAAYRTLGVRDRVTAVAALRKYQSGQRAREPFLPGIISHRRHHDGRDVKRRMMH